MKTRERVPELTEAQAVAAVYRAVLGLAVVLALVLPATLRAHDVEISTRQFDQARLASEEAATEHRRDAFEARRLAYAATPNRALAFIASAKAHVGK